MKHVITKLEDIKNDVNSEIKYNVREVTTSSPTFVSLKDLINKYLAEYKVQKSWTETYLKTQSNYLFSLERYFYNINISELKREGLIEYIDTFLAKLKKDKSNDLISKKTINQHLTTITSFFKYLLANDYINKNICTDIKLKIKEEDEIIRLPYADNDISVLLDYFSSNVRSKYKKEFIDIMNIAQYSGMRLNEILQLTSTDIVTVDNILCFDVNSDGKKSLKNKHSKRLVPIHSKIIDLSNELKKNKNLFTVKHSYFTKKYSEYNANAGFGETKVFHSFRHTFSDKLKQQRIENTIIDELTGHAHSESGMSLGRYANKYEVSILKEVIEKVKY